LESEFYDMFFAGHREAAEHALDTIEYELGVSNWSVRNRIALLQEVSGLEAQKAYFARVRAEAPRNSVGAFLAYYVSIRNEPTVTPSGFRDELERLQQQTVDISADAFLFLLAELSPDGPLSDDACEAKLRYSQSSTVIDAYEAFVDVAKSLCATKHITELRHLQRSIAAIRQKVTDDRLEALAMRLRLEGHALAPSTDTLDTIEDWLRGNNLRAARRAVTDVPSRRRDPLMLDIAARALAMEGTDNEPVGGFPERVVRLMARVATHDGSAAESQAELRKLAMNFPGHPWAAIVELFVARETSANPVLLQEREATFATATLPVLSPLVIPSLQDRVARLDYAERIEECAGRRLATTYAFLLAGESVDTEVRMVLQEDLRVLLEAEQALYQKNYDQALRAAEAARCTQNVYLRRLAVRAQCYCLLKLGQYGDCVRTLAAAFVEDMSSYRMLPVKEAVEGLTRADCDTLKSSPLLSIARDLYNTVTEATDDKHIKYAFQDFLVEQRVLRPSELAVKLDTIPREQLLYFLRHVSVEPVMEGAIGYDRSLTFKTSRALIDERIAICRLLVNLDPTNADEYEAEIRQLLRRLLIRDRLRDVEQRRIHVDLEGVAQSIHYRVEESFRRFVAFVRHGFHVDESEGERLPRRRHKGGESQAALDLFIPENEARALILRIAEDMRDEYVLHDAYGLHGYLSLWIRHGALVEQLRSPIEAAHLITKQRGETGEYTWNEFWDERLEGSGPEARREIERHLLDFAQEFDALLISIRDEWIQIKRRDTDRGLFDFRIGETIIKLMTSMVEEGMPFDDFVATSLGVFGERLDDSLSSVRHALEHEAEVRAGEMLMQLQAHVNRYAEEADLREFNNAIADARVGMQAAFDRVSAWFYQSVESATEPVAMADAVQIAVESMRTQSRVIVPVTMEEAVSDPPLIRGSMLQALAAVFALIFDNVVRRSGIQGPEFHPTVIIQYPDGRIRCRVENPLAPRVKTAEAHQRLEEIRTTIREGRYMSIVGGEGGTGFFKMAKVLTHDIGVPPELTFGYTEEERFFVQFVLPQRLLQR
jgi:hypothetical protein